MSGYVWQHDLEGERDRLRLMSDLLDPSSQFHLLRTGITAAWRCLEIGAGNGSLSQWLTQRVGSAGHVVASDICTDLVEGIAGRGRLDAYANPRDGRRARWSPVHASARVVATHSSAGQRVTSSARRVLCA